MEELKKLRYEVLNLRNMNEISVNAETKLLHKLNALQEAINYTRCSTQLKEKYGKDFEYFVTNQVNVQKIDDAYWFKDRLFVSIEELYEEWLKITKPLIV